ncbi:MAG: SDR family oxidoreductase [Rhodocyclaceae bacterium]|nr:SDR family oxidoreductase [Rhodocyclaceae bacterium]
MTRKKKRLLIIGCGDVARRALPRLLRQWRVYALVRDFDPNLRALGVTQIVGDLDRRAELARLSGLAHAVLQTAPPPPEGEHDPRTRRLLAVLRRAGSLARRWVYISTSGVYGDCRGAWIDETHPVRPQTARAKRRLDAERCLRRAGRRGLIVSILRAPGIYAENRLPLERIRRGEPALLPEEDSYTNHIHAEDLAQACVRALSHGRPNRVYHVCDDSCLPMGAWFDKLADVFSLPRPPRMSRAEARARLSPQLWSFMNESRRLLNRRMKRELGVRLLYPTVDHGLAALKEERKCFG